MNSHPTVPKAGYRTFIIVIGYQTRNTSDNFLSEYRVVAGEGSLALRTTCDFLSSTGEVDEPEIHNVLVLSHSHFKYCGRPLLLLHNKLM